jgi:putative FmdB family regulatory protein
MPLFDFRCRGCGREFEALVRTGSTTTCPACQSIDLERQLPIFAVKSAEKTRAAADKNIRKAAAIARRDNAAMEREIDEHRHEDH